MSNIEDLYKINLISGIRFLKLSVLFNFMMATVFVPAVAILVVVGNLLQFETIVLYAEALLLIIIHYHSIVRIRRLWPIPAIKESANLWLWGSILSMPLPWINLFLISLMKDM